MKINFRKRSIRVSAVIGICLVALYFGVSPIVSPFLRRRLEAMVASHLNAELHMGHLSYRFPYGLHASDVSLQTLDGHGPIQIFTAKRIDFVLAELPHRQGPLVIKKLILVEPAIKIIRSSAGPIEGHDLVRHNGASPKIDLEKMRLSDMFRLRRFAIENGRVIYVDQRQAGAPPMAWSGIRIDLNIQPQSGSRYSYKVDAKHDPLARLLADGWIDVDTLKLEVKQFAISVQNRADSSAAELPIPVQQFLKSYPITGELKLTGTAMVPLRNPMRAQYDAMLDLPGVTAKLLPLGASLDKLAMQLHIASKALPLDDDKAPATRPAEGIEPASVRIAKLEAASGDFQLKLEKGVLDVDQNTGGWSLRDLLGTVNIGPMHNGLPTRFREMLDELRMSGSIRFTAMARGTMKPAAGQRRIDSIEYELLATPRDLGLKPKGFPLPLEKLAGAVRLRRGVVSVENLECRYGADRLTVNTAHVPLHELRQSVKIEDLSGTVDFGGQEQRYPRFLNTTLSVLRPMGLWAVSGGLVFHPGKKDSSEYKIGLSSDRASLKVAIDGKTRRLPASDLKTDILISGVGPKGIVEINSVQAVTLEGRFSGKGRISIDKPAAYEATGHLQDISMPQLAAVWALPGEKPSNWTGRGFADAKVSGTGPKDGKEMLDLLQAEGEFEILNGDFVQVQVLKDIASSMNLPDTAAIVGEAAGVARIRDRTVEFDRAAVSAPVLGLQGTGTIGFDGALDLKVIAAPLADWKANIKRTGVPIISNVTGEVAGGIQKLFNGATRTLLYEFHVTGTLPNAQLETVPAPVLKDGVAKLFGSMIAPKKDKRLIDAMHKPEK